MTSSLPDSASTPESPRERHSAAALVLNLLLPGTGLIVAGREWLGISLATLFGICAHVALAGWFVAPLAWPHWLTWLGTALAGASWTAAQLLLRMRRRNGV